MILSDWIKNKKLVVTFLIENTTFSIKGVEGCFYIMNQKDILLSEEMRLIFSEEEVLSDGCDFYVFEWGGKWFYEKKDYERVSFISLENLGIVDQVLENNKFPFLGLHGEFELYNGSSRYQVWIDRAKFLGYKSLALVERNTLAGVLSFQSICEKNKVKSIIGEEISVMKEGSIYFIKIYTKNQKGWEILLRINKEIRVVNERPFIEEERLFQIIDKNVIIVLDKWVKLTQEKIFDFTVQIQSENLYYQWDTPIYKNNIRDGELLKLQQRNLKYFKDKSIKFTFINDSYYINKEDFEIKKKLNEMNPKSEIEEIAENQYLKDLDDNFFLMEVLFVKNDILFDLLFSDLISNAIEIGENCNFKYQIEGSRLPLFTQDHLSKEIRKETNEELFWSLIEKGVEERLVKRDKIENLEPYFERIEMEMALIQKGGFIDYFLVLWDIIRYSNENDILIGPGRGSSVGSLICYLTKITNIDPLKYNLIFERFLNEGRLGKKVEKKVVIVNDSTRFDFDQKINILRLKEELQIKACELKEDDKIIT